MSANHALVPTNNLFSPYTDIDHQWETQGQKRNRFQDNIVVRVYNPDQPDSIYGPCGKIITKLLLGENIDLYI